LASYSLKNQKKKKPKENQKKPKEKLPVENLKRKETEWQRWAGWIRGSHKPKMSCSLVTTNMSPTSYDYLNISPPQFSYDKIEFINFISINTMS